MKANVYVDAFNLYHRALKGTPFKWLDIRKLCELALPRYWINRIHYCTALIQGRPNDPQQAQRQQIYIRALQTDPGVTVHLGNFLTNPVTLPLAKPRRRSKFATVLRTEEKGSDVNIATMLLCDGYENAYEAAIVISNDSDLVMPIRVVRDRLQKPVVLFCPSPTPNAELAAVATYVKSIRKGVLRASQFPPALADANGTITKPQGW
jgi:uncharacterized LabA/DUF88 family protein